jgi:hypothetical protein
MATVAEIFCKLNGKDIPSQELEKTVSQAAARFGAGPGLTASLVRGLPNLYEEVLTAHQNDAEAIIHHAPKLQYRIWTNGESKVVSSIEKYSDCKKKYLFWIDLNEKHHISTINPKRRITWQSVKLLQYLVENLGAPVPLKNVLRDVFDAGSREITDTDQNSIEQQVTKLHKFCGEKFRQHLFGERAKNGLGLKMSFKDKYFLFSRIR